MKTIQSILNGSKIAYQLSDDWNWELRGQAALCLNLLQYETYGDSLTHHSRAWCVQFADVQDVCLSLTKAILAEPDYTAWKALVSPFHESNEEVIKFVMGLHYREDKEQWYSVQLRKVSTSDSKRHDKRWIKMETWVDGSPANCLSILLNSVGNVDWFSKLCWADDLRKAMGYPMWEDIFKPTAELPDNWIAAFQGLRAAIRGITSLDFATRNLECTLGNIERAQAVKEVA